MYYKPLNTFFLLVKKNNIGQTTLNTIELGKNSYLHFFTFITLTKKNLHCPTGLLYNHLNVVELQERDYCF